jgi:hypothetical protein
MADAPNRIAEIKAEFDKMLVALQSLEPQWRTSTELEVLRKLREFTDTFTHLPNTR